MPRRLFVRHLRAHGCVRLREGGRHSIYYNPLTGQTAPVPRHRDIARLLVRQICRELGIPEP